MLDRVAKLLFLVTMLLLPWGGLLSVPALHEHAQWSDFVFAGAVAAWIVGLLVARQIPRLRLAHAGIALYLGWAALSLVFASPRPASGAAKLLGMAMLAALFVLSSEMARRPGMPAAIVRTVAATTVLTGLAAVAGVVLSAFGISTPLVGGCGDLVQGPLARAQAGFPHPNLLGSFCIFAYGVVARDDGGLPRLARRAVMGAIVAAALLATSRAILGLLLAVAIRHAATPAKRRWAWTLAGVLLLAMVGLSVSNVILDPMRPWQAYVAQTPSARYLAMTSAFGTLTRHPLFGLGPGSSPGWRQMEPFDAHLTPLNIAATLGLPALAGIALLLFAVWKGRRLPTDRVMWGTLAGLALDGVGQDVEDFRHVWVALGLADAGRREGDA